MPSRKPLLGKIGLALAVLIAEGCGPGASTLTPEVPQSSTPAVSPKEPDSAGNLDPASELTTAARLALGRGDRATADRIIQRSLIANPNNRQTLELAGDLSAADGKAEQAVAFYQHAIDQSAQPTAELMDKAGQQFMSLGHPFEALEMLESIVTRYPENIKSRVDLVGLMGALGLQRRAAEHLRYLVQHQQAGLEELIWLTDLNRPQTDSAICNYALDRNPTDLRPSFALASSLAYQEKWTEAKQWLQPLCEQRPNFVEAWAVLGRTLVELGNELALREWVASLPAQIQSDPQYWIAAGIWAERNGAIDEATYAYWNAANLNENDGEALTRLGNCLAILERIDESKRVRHRAALITAMRDDVESLFAWRNHSQRAAVAIAVSMGELGRVWEAATWARIAVMMNQDPDDSAESVFSSIRRNMTGKTPWQAADSRVTHTIDTAGLPTIHWATQSDAGPTEFAQTAATRTQFSDQAEQRGLKHVCEIDHTDRDESGLWIYQSGAGGAGAIDYDIDGWPDFYLTACDGVPREFNSAPNRLFRSLGGNYVDVTAACGAGDLGFAQGIAVGDCNSDGFPDLMVANFGANRLLCNNGDGTFADITAKVKLSGDLWTTSVAIADCNGDAIADIFEVNYIGGNDVITRRCYPDGGNEHRSCGPLVFPAQADRLWLGRGDGTFANASDQCLPNQDPGRGLGLVVGLLDEQPGVDVLVSNDMTANHFWSTSQNTEEEFRFDEQAAVRGLAVSGRSVSQASMGIAADDADGDGDLDFYLTHFFDDYNTLYMQLNPGIWSDRTSASKLDAPTDPMLAFGTQWIDADNDGDVELAVANGNVDDFTATGHAFRMPMQLFQRTANSDFVCLSAESLGPYFESMRLGRALLTVDANRDQRVDMLVTHLFDPVSLLINQSTVKTVQLGDSPGNLLTFYLVATSTHRDAIGATVRIEFDGRVRSRQLLAGNGYQCANERCLRFGVGPETSIDRVTVLWPGGKQQSIQNVQSNREYLWVEELAPLILAGATPQE